jgi:aryl sulfotransferase
MSQKLPQVTRTYQNYVLNNTRWEKFTPRDDDIIVTTSYKSGTTWMQMIMKHLLIPDGTWDGFQEFSPWLDANWRPIDEVITDLEAQTHRRCIKSHLAFDGLPYYPQVKYIIVGRDARDVFMSFWNHYDNFTDSVFEESEDRSERVGDPMPRSHGDIHKGWKEWMTQGWFEWETEGYPFWGNLHHAKTYWEFRNLPNLIFVHYNNLLNDCHAEIRRITDYIDLSITDEQIDKVVELTSFKNVRANSEKIMGDMESFKGGSKTFINKGTNGRWKDVFSDEELALYDEAVKRVLTPDCAHWLETGQFDFNQ